MLKYFLKRIALAVVTIFIVMTLTFILMNAVPGGPFVAEKSISPAAQRALEAKYGLDKPLFERYVTYISDALHGDFGISLKQRGRTVSQIITSRFPVSAKIGGLAALLALYLIIVVATCGIAVPGFVFCTVLMYTFGVKLGWLPTFGLGTPKHYIMPVVALAFYPMAYITRLMRSSMLDVLGQDYMRTAKAKGLSQFKSLFKHALRNAVLPVITYVGPMIAYTLTGSFVVEKILSIPGLGREFVSAITNRDYTMIMGTTIVLATLVIVMNVIVDIVYKLVDPRIQLK